MNGFLGPLEVVETFMISGRGLVVVLDGATDLPVGRAIRATVTTPDGHRIAVSAFREWLLRREPTHHERECFLLAALAKQDVPAGSTVTFEGA
ncbi:MAG: hypothetical protein H6736_23130 [Alphaproteobacteria bacterium]|nr:hypothetical protein [Alphaproteobacteria bacterium]MCB9672787.1 hypothetical protein [Alphaproteobacteria bacterium]MCB9694715.1 hypothetical protein [Alphaproteobacteria bacterium]